MSNQIIKRGVFLDPENYTNVNYDYVSKNVDFAIIKAFGKSNDESRNQLHKSQFSTAYTKASGNNIKTGIYYELDLKSDEVTSQKKIQDKIDSIVKYLCDNYLSGRKYAYPVYFGLTQSYLFQSNLSYIVNYLNEKLVIQKRYWIGFCVASNHLEYIEKNASKIRRDYSFWVTNRGLSKAQNEYYMIDNHLGMWEYSTTERVIGINKDCSMSFCFEDYPKLISADRRNGF